MSTWLASGRSRNAFETASSTASKYHVYPGSVVPLPV